MTNNDQVKMQAVVSTEIGGPETLSVVEQEIPVPSAGQVRIAVKAAGVNFPDTLIIKELYQFKAPRPFSPGSEVSGVVDAIGEGVEGLTVGDRVLATNFFGGFASHFISSPGQVMKIPDAMPHEEAAAFLNTYGTSQYALRDRGRVSPGEVVFVLGAAGGVGSAAIEISKAIGAKVIAGVSSEEKAAFCKDLGADETIVYPREMDRDAQKALGKEIKAKAAALGRSEGADVVYDAVGGAYAEPALRALGWDGRFLVVGFPAGIPNPPLNLVLLKSTYVIGVAWGAFTMRNQKRHSELMTELFNWYSEGKVRPRVVETFPLKDAAKALTRLEERKATGKIVLTV